MATSMLDIHTPFFPRRLSAEDFETASIRSAAPSYTSDVPSYHSTAPNPDPLPPYTPPPARAAPPYSASSSSSTRTGPGPASSVSSLLDPFPDLTPTTSTSTTTRRQGLPPVPSGLPPVPSGPPRSQQPQPDLAQFRIPSWSSSSNPTARIYHNVALRRASAASSAAAAANMDGLMRRVMLERIEEEERNRVRPLEDPYLVGEEAAARARRERLARESGGEEVLRREDRAWDFFLAQMKDREQRERSWKQFRRDRDRRSSNRLLLRGARF